MDNSKKCLSRANCGWTDGGRYVCHCFDVVPKNKIEEVLELTSSVLARIDTLRTENESMMANVLEKIKRILSVK